MLVTASTLLFAAVVNDWIHSISYSETLILVRGSHVYAIDNYNGEIAFWRGRFKLGESYPDGLHHEHWGRGNGIKTMHFSVDDPMGGEIAFAGFVITQQRHFPTTNVQTFPPMFVVNHLAVVIPSWFLTLLFGALPGTIAFRWIRGVRRRGEGFCSVCGYDLRASTTRCPECGTAISEAAPARQTLS
jgi:hypothetical protein